MPDGIWHRTVAVGAREVHVAETGSPDGKPFLLLHGWPASWRTWRPLMTVAPEDARMIAIDLPGVGGSAGPSDGSKRDLAGIVHQLVSALDLRRVTLIGHDIGGMVAYAYLRGYTGPGHAAIIDKERGGDIRAYAEGLRQAGAERLEYATVPGCGHFPQEESLEETWRLIAGFTRP